MASEWKSKCNILSNEKIVLYWKYYGLSIYKSKQSERTMIIPVRILLVLITWITKKMSERVKAGFEANYVLFHEITLLHRVSKDLNGKENAQGLRVNYALLFATWLWNSLLNYNLITERMLVW